MKMKKLWDKELNELPEDASAGKIEDTASTLEGMHYEPLLLFKTPGFLRMGEKAIALEVARISNMTDAEMMEEGLASNADFNEFKAKHIQLLIYHYNLLCRLRNDDPTAWDIINELLEDD
ncbi:MAG: hypothetical protein GXY61_12055 [Lentisphaerae bacterium]|jgi:hypothetical protein|nr:hypothetical protein [Lentisphaerota bacterium]